MTTMATHRTTSALLALALAVATLPGCLERKILVTSEPPGAIVEVNDVEIGRTPAETDFTFYGDYDVRVKLDGYDTVREKKTASAPLYEYPPFDLVATALPFDIENTVKWHFVLRPATTTPENEGAILDRARELRGLVDKPGEEPTKDE